MTDENVKVNVMTFARGTKDSGISPSGTLQTFTAADLLSRKFEPIKWVIPGVLPEGSTLLVGASKIGKSWLALDWCAAVASGGKAMGSYPVDPGHVLYLALEDNDRRICDRLRKIAKDVPDFLHFATISPRLDTGLIPELTRWIGEHPGTRLIVIDVLVKVRAPAKDRGNVYEADYVVGSALTRLAGETGIAIVAIHHENKSNDEDKLNRSSGSTGINGSFDNCFHLERKRGAGNGELYITGRNIEHERTIGLWWEQSQALWRSDDYDGFTGETVERKLFRVVRKLGKATPVDVMREAGLSQHEAQRAATTLISLNMIKIEDGCMVVCK